MPMALKKSDAPWTYEDLLALPDDGKRYEIIEGTLYEMTAPNTAHAAAVMNLIAALLPIVAALGGRLFTAPVDLFIRGANPVQPDLMAILPGSRATIVRRGVEGPPDLLIEVISPSNRDHDELTKRALYGRAGVREYWLVDPDARTLEVLTLDRDALHSYGTFIGEAIVDSPLLEAAFPVASVFVGIDAE
jgi:Uma2 family endonuclease